MKSIGFRSGPEKLDLAAWKKAAARSISTGFHCINAETGSHPTMLSRTLPGTMRIEYLANVAYEHLQGTEGRQSLQ